MPEIQIPSALITGLQIILAFSGAFFLALWLSLIIWTFRDVRLRSRDIFAIMLATLMVVIFGPLGLVLYFLLRPPVTLAELYERSLEEEALLQDLEERPRCPGCSRQVNEAWIVCPDCHTTLKKVCDNCNNSLHLNWRICPFCGMEVGPAPVEHDHYDPSGEILLQEEPPLATLTPGAATQTRPMTSPPPSIETDAKPVRRGDETRPHMPEVNQLEIWLSKGVDFLRDSSVRFLRR